MKQVSNDEKIKRVSDYLNKLYIIAEKNTKNGDYNTALCALSISSLIQYQFNQIYTDKKTEDLLIDISNKIIHRPNNYKEFDNTVLFYDGFGLDRRGIAIIMCKAIVSNGYKLIYVSPEEQKDKQPTLNKILNKYDVVYEYYEKKGNYLKCIDSLKNAFLKWHPKTAFFYTYPYDVSGTVVFNSFKDLVYRFQLDLTDHAFWLGINAFDKCNGGRKYSSSIEHYYRGIPKEKLTLLDGSLFVDDYAFDGLPFEEDKRFIFSGGSLYKTLGDENNTYYKILDHILSFHKEIYFLYAGSGDDHLLKQLESKFPGRVFLVSERKDFYEVMKRCVLYLNTYPMFGGLMMRYAAMAGKIPITLKHAEDSDGILIDQSSRMIEYNTYDELIKDVDKLLTDNVYLHQRESKLIGSVVTEECFFRNIKMMIEEHRTEFPIGEIEFVDTEQFRKEYLERFKLEYISNTIANKRGLRLAPYFPKEFLHGCCSKLNRKLLGG